MNIQPINSAARYRQIKDARRAESLKTAETFEVTTTSGMVWTVRRPNLETYLVNGVMPSSLVERLAGVMDKDAQSVDAIAKSLSPTDTIKSIIFAREIVRDICICPRIAEHPQSDDEIAPGEIELDDFNDLVEWAMRNTIGGDEARKLQNFRR